MKKTVIKIGLKCVAASAVICGSVALKKCITENKKLKEGMNTYKTVCDEQQKLIEKYKQMVGQC
jgi:hypothetical protein